MKFVEPNHFADPDAAVRKLLEIANALEAVKINVQILKFKGQVFRNHGFRAGTSSPSRRCAR